MIEPGDVRAAVLAVLPGRAADRMHVSRVHVGVRGLLPGVTQPETMAALLALLAERRVVRTARHAKSGHPQERWYRLGAVIGVQEEPPPAALFDIP
jgi:hypothetical protein